jgi:tetratricopeptide (TPR) repeat protein
MFGFIGGKDHGFIASATVFMTNKPQKPETQPKADERNIVSLDSDYEGASLEDRLYLIWHNYQKVIIGVCAAAAVVLAGWGIIHVAQERREARIASEYQEAGTIDEKLAFAERTVGHVAAGAAFLEVADHYFSEGGYDTAAAHYLRAANDLGDLPTAGRAKIGHAVSLAMSGRESEALTAFEGVGRDAGNYSIVRAEAYYHAATLAIGLGQPATARSYIERVNEYDQSQMWSRRAMGLSQALPDEEEAAPAAELSDAG